jgi:transposase, IS6 family
MKSYSFILDYLTKFYRVLYLSKTREKKAAKRFFKKALRSFHVSKPRVIIVDKNPVYSIAVEEWRKEKNMPSGTQLRHQKDVNNIVEKD